MGKAAKIFGYDDLWKEQLAVFVAEKNSDLILESAKSLPLEYWRKNFFFKGALNRKLRKWTCARFGDNTNPEGTHPVFALKPICSNAGFKVCPCSSAPQGKYSRWIKKGTPLLYTGILMDKKSFLVERIQFNIPSSEAGKLNFLGEVPEEAIRSRLKKGQ